MSGRYNSFVEGGVRCGLWLITLVGVVLVGFFALSAALLATGTRLRDDLSQAGIVSGFIKSTAFVSEASVIQTGGGLWVAVWKGPFSRYSLIRNPLAVYAQKAYAEEDLHKMMLNFTYTIMCPSNAAPLLDYPSVASLRSVCMADVETVEYLQRVHGVADYGASTLLAIGSVALVLVVLGVVLVCIGKGWCYCCGGCCPDRPDSSAYVAEMTK